jgi:hypothetical protein
MLKPAEAVPNPAISNGVANISSSAPNVLFYARLRRHKKWVPTLKSFLLERMRLQFSLLDLGYVFPHSTPHILAAIWWCDAPASVAHCWYHLAGIWQK